MSARQQTRKQRLAYDALLDFVIRGRFPVGAQLPGFPEIAREIGVSVTLLKRVVLALRREGFLDVVPKVGTFVKRLPLAPAEAETGRPTPVRSPFSPRIARSEKAVRVYVAEDPNVAGDYWRRTIAAYEKANPDCSVQMTLASDPGDPDLGADVLFVQTHIARRFSDDLVEWVDPSPITSGLLPTVRDMVEHSPDRRTWPVALGVGVMYVNRPALLETGLYRPGGWRTPDDVIETCRRYLQQRAPGDRVAWGWVDDMFAGFVLSEGLLARPFSSISDTIEKRLKVLATVGPPVLVSGIDARQPGIPMVALRRKNALFVSGHCWEHHSIDRSCWEALPAPFEDPRFRGFGVMVVALSRRSRRTADALRFARFLSGPEAQGRLADAGGLLPVLSKQAARHPLFPIYRDCTASGWVREEFTMPPEHLAAIYYVLSLVGEVRAQRSSVVEAMRGLASLERYPLNLVTSRGGSKVLGARTAPGRRAVRATTKDQPSRRRTAR